MASFNKVRVKKLYMPTAHGTKKGHGNRSTEVTATATELNLLDGVTATTAELNLIDGVTATTAEINRHCDESYFETATLQAAEHGAGAIGTAFAPRTYRWEENGHIVTEIHVDLTGLGVVGTAADDVIGLVTAAPDAYIGRIVTATYGVVYKVEAICIEVPAGTATITTDINITLNSGGELGYDEAAGNDYLFNTGGLVAGEIQTNIEPTTITNNDYIYLTEGDTAATTGVYTAGQYILRFYGHALIT